MQRLFSPSVFRAARSAFPCNVNTLRQLSGRLFPVQAVHNFAAAANSEEFVDNDNLMEMFPTPVKRRVLKLKELQIEQQQIDGEFLAEKAELEKKFQVKYGPIFEQRRDVIAGTAAVPDYGQPENPDEPDEGVPDFWLTAMSNFDAVGNEISDRDAEVLSYLADVRSEVVTLPEENASGFKLTFVFRENPFLQNKELTKTYVLENSITVIPKRLEGCKIDWYPGQNVTVTEVKKKVKSKGKGTTTVTKLEPCQSFFNFFNPPVLPDDPAELSDEQLDELQQEVDRDYEIGLSLKEQIVPEAIDWFTGEAALARGDEDEFGDEFEDEEEEEAASPPRKGSKRL